MTDLRDYRFEQRYANNTHDVVWHFNLIDMVGDRRLFTFVNTSAQVTEPFGDFLRTFGFNHKFADMCRNVQENKNGMGELVLTSQEFMYLRLNVL